MTGEDLGSWLPSLLVRAKYFPDRQKAEFGEITLQKLEVHTTGTMVVLVLRGSSTQMQRRTGYARLVRA